MKFTDPLTALEFYINHRTDGSFQTSKRNQNTNTSIGDDSAIVAVCDIERMLDRFPAPLMRSLIDFAMNGKVNRFTDRTLRQFAHNLADAGYLQANPSGAQMAVAA